MPDTNLELELIKACNPFPSVTVNGVLRDGILFVQPKICVKCSNRECKTFYAKASTKSVDHLVCPSGMSVFIFNFSFGKIVSTGLIEMFMNDMCKPAIRKKFRTQKIRFESVERWWKSSCNLSVVINTLFDTRVNEGIQSLHDINTAVRLVKSFAGRIIQRFPGQSDDEKIESAPEEIKALYKSVLLLGRRLEMSNIIANPESAGFGQKRPTPIYKIFDLICQLFKEVAHLDGGKHVIICGSSHKIVSVYNSFETLALALIDNAVKYCEKKGTVNILVNDVQGGVRVSVENPGPLVPYEYHKNIFDKGFRTPSAKDMQSSGRGFGLYIASIIAKVHGFILEYVPLKTGDASSSDKGINAFRFIVPD
jgi:hypothetical protein